VSGGTTIRNTENVKMLVLASDIRTSRNTENVKMLVSVSDGKTTRSSDNATTLASVSYDKMIRKYENALGGMTDYPNFVSIVSGVRSPLCK
jgi:hypothetical protein